MSKQRKRDEDGALYEELEGEGEREQGDGEGDKKFVIGGELSDEELKRLGIEVENNG
jgi:hypothetical protein